MFETNSASCGGFAGISDSFGAALWLLDYGLQMAYSNFSGALVHVGGQNVYYNVSVVALLSFFEVLTRWRFEKKKKSLLPVCLFFFPSRS
jgi:hypothetical protein